MINSDSLYTSFRQTHDSCVLAAFAVSSHAFNRKVTPQKLFKLFCLHFDDKLLQLENVICEENPLWEKEYVSIFNKKLNEYHISGNKLIKNYFDKSKQELIEECRKIFTVQLVEVKKDEGLPQKLKENEAILAASYQLNTGNYHSISIGVDSTTSYCFFVDTNTPNAIQPFHPNNFKILGDGLYLVKI
jgi:hypothetical protein